MMMAATPTVSNPVKAPSSNSPTTNSTRATVRASIRKINRNSQYDLRRFLANLAPG